MNTLASRRYTKSNLDPDPPPIFKNPNLIPWILRQESSPSPRPVFKSNSCLVEWLFLKDLPFDKYFGFSQFRTTSDSEFLDIVVDLKFTKELEIERTKLISNRNLQNSPQSSLTIDRIPELSNSASTYFASSSFPYISENHMSSPFIPLLPQQPIITPQTPITSITSIALVVISPSVTSTSISNPPQVMVARYAPLVLPQNLDDMPIDYQSKIPLFCATESITAQQHVDRMNEFFGLHEVDAKNVSMILFLQSFEGEV